MRRLMAVIAATGLGALSMYLAFHVHLVRTDSNWYFVRKQKTEFADCFADVRTWDASEWSRHPDLKLALKAAGRGKIIKEPAGQELLFNALDVWKSASRNSDTTRQ